MIAGVLCLLIFTVALVLLIWDDIRRERLRREVLYGERRA